MARKARQSNSRAARWGRAVSAALEVKAEIEAAQERLEEALSELRELRDEYESWKENLDGKFEGSALVDKLEAVCDLDFDSCELDLSPLDVIEEAEAADLPLGWGRD